MKEISPQENLRQVLFEFENELQILQSQQVFTKLDAQKIRAQVEVTQKAMLTAKDESSFNDRAKEKLLNALIRDFEKSILRTVDEAVGRKGDKALLSHRLNRVDRRIALKMDNANISHNELRQLEVSMKLLKSYIFRSLPEKSNSLWGSAKLDTGILVANYEKTLDEYIQNNFTGIKLLG
jgi:hypothetical protein